MGKSLRSYGKIGELLTAWLWEIKFNKAYNLLDPLRVAEQILKPLCNIAFDQEFIHLEGFKSNHPAIDLGRNPFLKVITKNLPFCT